MLSDSCGTQMLIPAVLYQTLRYLKYGKQCVDEAVTAVVGVPSVLKRLNIWLIL